MNELPTMTQTEAKALVDSIRACFGACLCQQYATAPGLGKMWIDVCEGHAFLNEPHRLARLLWVRRTRDSWETAEHVLTPSQKLSRLLEQQVAEIVDRG